jgi:hypothetical protein
MPADIQQRIWSFVRSGGGLIVAGEPETRLSVGENVMNELLEPTGMSFRDDTANSLTDLWESNLLAAPHAAVVTGGQSFGFGHAASIRVTWPASPLLAGRWCWDEVGSDPMRGEPLAYEPGSRLGDLVLAAQQNVGGGRVVVLGDATCLSNDGIPFSYTFCGPMLAALANHAATPMVWWRQLLALAAAAGATLLLFYRADPLQLATAALALAIAAFACDRLNDATPQLLPTTAKSAKRPLIYVDGSHLEALGKDPWRDDGIGHFMRVLTEANYLPLLAPDLSPARLAGAKVVISIAPGRQFGGGEIENVKDYVENGGTFLSMTGSPDAGPSQPMLDALGLRIADMPLPPSINAAEAEPLGAAVHDFNVPRDSANAQSSQTEMMRFHAAWPVGGVAGGATWPTDDPKQPPVIARNFLGQGQAFLIGDSQFALPKGIAPPVMPGDPSPENALFWRTTLRSWLEPRDK